MMLRAVTNRDFPLLRRALKALFDMELDVDPSIRIDGRLRILREYASSDPAGRIRILFVANTSDLSFGLARGAEVTGRSYPHGKLAMIAVPDNVTPVSEKCIRKTGTIDGFLAVVALHELYEVLTGDFNHCDHPRRCINSRCRLFETGTCSSCMGGILDGKSSHLKLEDIYCEEHSGKLKAALKTWNALQ